MARWRWLESTRWLQKTAYASDPDAMTTEERAASIKDNALALVDETMEVLHEVSWKFWAHDAPFVNRDKVLKEAVDAGHFLGNILVAAGVSDDEYEAAYQAKQRENLRRQQDGYEVRGKNS